MTFTVRESLQRLRAEVRVLESGRGPLTNLLRFIKAQVNM